MGFSEEIYRRGDVGMAGYQIAAKNPPYMSKMICSILRFLSSIQRKSLHIRPVLCKKSIHSGPFLTLRILSKRSSDGLLSPELPFG